MFCPKCAITNLDDAKFCRGCGHSLAGHRAALESNFEDALEKIKTGSTALGISAIGLILVSLMALGVWTTQNDAGVFFTLVPVLVFVTPAAVLGLIRLTRAFRMLNPPDRGTSKHIEQARTAAIHLGVVADTDPLAQTAQASVSVTEHTTLNLKSSEAGSGEVGGSRQVDSPSSRS